MVFTKRLREGIRRGRIRCSVRIWTGPHVKAGGRYRMDEGQIVVDSIMPMRLADITADLARESGYSRQHLLRIRMGTMEPTRRCIAAIVSACRRLSHEHIRADDLFELGGDS